ncbi:hypothetical protein [Paenibacillus methanolicus]|uniref:Uncharacterized protein n=1 Tax=Paenibacillus methanolicus TaxID=582686 RepID=A0A5S5C1L8_9BACL|nr:hypothetical protein [Paenibacillus methanolicus]TYP73069.1 hypothetical protein BCM02_10753 [Paenibacillus methanolicus]
MHTNTERMSRITLQMAEEAWERPLQDSGLWHHNDIRNNFYDAAYLYAAAADERLDASFDRREAADLASNVFMHVLELQDRNPESPTYGHWPLHLGERPELAPIHTLPAELMSALMVYWQYRYEDAMDEQLSGAFEHAIRRMYESGFFRRTVQSFNHHEAKYTAAKLLFGQRYGDADLLAAGRRDLQLTLARIREAGMAEYGALPWFWHWVQAFSSAYYVVEDDGIREEIADLLEELWLYRARHYLNGAWIGGRMRSLPVDLPRDRNVAFDYVQFGDFELPRRLPRAEFAGLLHVAGSEEVSRTAWRSGQEEIAYAIVPADGGAKLHQTIYRTAHAATGGILERVAEFDNEQHRWEITLPLSEAEGANRLYLFSPGAGYAEGDPRHASDRGELMLRKHTALGLYAPQAEPVRLVGVLPAGTWRREQNRAYGELQHLYAALFMPGGFVMAPMDDYVKLDSSGDGGRCNGFVVEVVEKEAAAALGIHTLDDFFLSMERRRPQWENEAGKRPSVRYRTPAGEDLELAIVGNEVVRSSNGTRLNR